jgi:hypothetical protein
MGDKEKCQDCGAELSRVDGMPGPVDYDENGIYWFHGPQRCEIHRLRTKLAAAMSAKLRSKV